MLYRALFVAWLNAHGSGRCVLSSVGDGAAGGVAAAGEVSTIVYLRE